MEGICQKASRALCLPTLLIPSQLNASLQRSLSGFISLLWSSASPWFWNMSVLLTTEVKLGFDLSFILQWLVSVCGRNWTRASKHQSDSHLIFFLRTRRTIRSSNLIISGGLVRAKPAASLVLDTAWLGPCSTERRGNRQPFCSAGVLQNALGASSLYKYIFRKKN